MPAWMWWVIIGLALLAAEIPNQSFYLAWFGIGALFAAAASAVFGLSGQLAVFFLSSIGLLLLLRPVTMRLIYSNTPHFDTNVDRMIGHVADCIQTVDNLKGSGLVRIFGSGYSASSSDDSVVIEAGTKVRIVRVAGVKLVVEPAAGVNPHTQKEG